MGGSHNAERITKSEGVKIVKMNFSEDDLRQAQIARLAEIKADLEKDIPKNLVFLMDIATIIGISTADKVRILAHKMGIKTYSRRRTESHKMGLSVTEEDAEKILRHYYQK